MKRLRIPMPSVRVWVVPAALAPLLFFFLVFSLVLSGVSPAVAASDSEGGDGLPYASYFEVTRPDLRLCPAPACGGVFVKLVNRRKMHCPDGSRGPECHAPIIDWSALGLSPAEEAELAGALAAKRLILRGELALADNGFGFMLPTLFVDDAWRAVTESEPVGRFYGITSSGIVCITHPCPIFDEIRLNRRRAKRIHALDLAASGASDREIERGFEALHDDGLLVAGEHRRIRGPAGRGRELVASEFYTRVKGGIGEERACGGFTYPPNPSCEEGEICEPPPGTCFIADLPGTCQPRPEICSREYAPVCGCDGRTYGNDCERLSAGVGLDRVGACETRGETCGDAICGPGTRCCNPLMGICTAPGMACIL